MGLLTIGVWGALTLAASGCKRDAPGSGPAPGGAPAAAAGQTVRVESGDVAQPQGAAPLRVVFGPRGKGIAYVARRSDGMHVVFNGREGRSVSAVDQVSISPDGERIAYAAEVEGTWRMVVDEVLSARSGGFGVPAFSPDGRHVAYEASAEGGRRLVVDGAEGPVRRKFVGPPVFGAGSDSVAFAEVKEDGEQARLVVSDLSLTRQRVACDGVLRFSADVGLRTLAAVVEDGGRLRVVTLPFAGAGAPKRGAAYDTVSAVAFAPGGSSVAYLSERHGKRYVVAGAVEQEVAFDEAGEVALDDAGRWALAARRGEAWHVLANGEEGPAYDRVVTPDFSPDGKFLVYRARKDGKRFVVVADRAGRTLREHASYEQVFPVQFTPDGRSVTYGVKDGMKLEWKAEPLER
jgi:roadblock/LC7 domain-containing protein